jgi:MFS family permease
MSTSTLPPIAPERPSRWADLFQGEAAAPFLALFGGVAMHACYLFITVTTLPTVVAEVGGLAFYAWVTTCFTVGSIVASAAAPIASARFGAQSTFIVSLGLFVLGSLVCATAPAMPVLIIGRLLQGLGGGALPALAYANIQTSLPAGLRSRGIAAVSGVWGMAALTGPLLGGFFAQYAGWRGVFYLPVPLALVLIMLVVRRPLRGALGAIGQATPVARLFLLSIAVLAVAAGSVPGTLEASTAGVVVGGALLGWTLRLDHVSQVPLIPTRAYDPTNALGAVALTMVGLTFSLSAVGFVPYVLQRAQGVSAQTAGYIEAVVTIAWTLAALATAHVSGRSQRRLMALSPLFAVLGSLVVAAGFWAGSTWTVVVAMALIGTGIGIGWTHLGNAMVTHAHPDQRDLTASFINTNQLIAMAFGTSLAGVLLNLVSFTTAHTVAEVARCGIILFAGFALAPLAGAFIVGRERRA